jgi:predicted nucleic acid-binding Zn ribbon protein
VTDRGEVRDIRGTMREFLESEGMRELDELLCIKESWKKIVGDEIAGLAKPYRLEEGRLYVGVGSHARVQDLLFRVQEMKDGIKGVLGMEIEEIIVKKINLK